TDGDDFPLLRLFLRRVGDDDAALGLLFAVETTNDHAVVQRTELHREPPEMADSFLGVARRPRMAAARRIGEIGAGKQARKAFDAKFWQSRPESARVPPKGLSAAVRSCC